MIHRNEILIPWQLRANSLLQSIDDLIYTLEPQAQLSLPEGPDHFTNSQREAIVNLFYALRIFAYKQFLFFLRVFDARSLTNANEYLLDISLFDMEYILRETAEQVASDIELLTRAFHQRAETDRMRETLLKADKLAFQALKPAVDNGLIGAHACITYFTKSLRSRNIPYANAALVGIPLTAMDEPRDLLGIPHEIGHIVYWHPKPRNGWRIAADQGVSLLTTSTATIAIPKWFEEIFADVYGCLIAGPAAALTMIELTSSKMSKAELMDDGVHPPSPIRPDLLIHALSKMAEPLLSIAGSEIVATLQESTSKIVALWHAWRDEYPKPEPFFENLNYQLDNAKQTVDLILTEYFFNLHGVSWSTGVNGMQTLSSMVSTAIDTANALPFEVTSIDVISLTDDNKNTLKTQFQSLQLDTSELTTAMANFSVSIESGVDFTFLTDRDNILESQAISLERLREIVLYVFEAGGWGFGGGGSPRVTKV